MAKFQDQFKVLNKNIEANLQEKGLWHNEVPPVTYVNNLDFYSSVNCLEFLRDIGKHFRVAAMMSRDSVKSRLESMSEDSEGMSFTEFSY